MTGVAIDVMLEAERHGLTLDALEARLADLHEPLAEIGEMLLTSTHDRFERGGPAPDGTPWAPLAPSTLARKQGPGPLRESLHLMGSMRYQMSGENLLFGTNAPYARAQFEGLPAHTIRPKRGKALMWPGAKHPVRQVNHPGIKGRQALGLSADDQVQIGEIIRDYLTT